MRILGVVVLLGGSLSFAQSGESGGDCLSSWLSQPELGTREVVLRVVDGYGSDLPAGVTVAGKVIGGTPWKARVPACLDAVDVVVHDSGERRHVTLDTDVKVLIGERRPRAAVTGFGEFGQVLGTGWGEGVYTRGAGGVRADVWLKYVHGSFALKGSTFTTNQYPQSPQFVFDVFVGLSHDWVLGQFTLFTSLDLGVWSSIVPSARATVALAWRSLIAVAFAGPAIYPIAMQPYYDRLPRFASTPFDKFIFLNAGLSIGWSFL